MEKKKIKEVICKFQCTVITTTAKELMLVGCYSSLLFQNNLKSSEEILMTFFKEMLIMGPGTDD